MLVRFSLREIIVTAMAVSAVFATSLANAEHNLSRPTVGLVLGGGGAKGAAHVGVLKALEEMKIPVDYIAGTSMGAYVGGLYATGMSADEIAVLIESIDWNKGYQDKVVRSDRRVRDKKHEDEYNLSTDLGFDFRSLKTPQGVVLGQNMLRILRDSTGNLPAFSSFDQLVIPFRSVATDIERLEPVIINDGQLTEAMLASMSVPGGLPPVALEGRYLVDGGAVNNMPVDVAKAMGADIVIAVDISTDYSPAGQLNSYLAVMNQLVNFMVRNSTQQQIANMDSDDVLLSPEVGDMETTEFDRMDEAYQKGYQAALLSENKLEKLGLSSGEYQHYIESKQDRRRLLMYGDQLTVDRVVLNNETHFSDDVLSERLSLSTGKMDSEKLEAAVRNLYALDRFETVRYHLEKEGDDHVLTVDVKEKGWGPNFADFRFGLEDNFESDTDFSLGVSINSTGLSEYGAELRTDLEIGTEKLAQTELYLPFTADQRYFGILRGAYAFETRNIASQGEEPSLSTANFSLESEYSEWQFEGALGWQPELWNEFRTGFRRVDGTQTIFSTVSRDYSRNILFANFTLDTLDNRVFPRFGSYIFAEYSYSRDTAEDEDGKQKDEATQLDIELVHAHSWERHTLYGLARYGTINNRFENLLIDPKDLGGFLNLSGVSRAALSGNNLAFGALVYRYRLLDNDFGLFQSPVYIGTSLEYGGVWNDPDISYSDIPFYTAGSIFAGVDSPVGPVILGYGRTENNFDSFYLIVGSQF